MLGRIARLFGLTRFEAEVLLLAAAPELDSAMPALCSDAGQSERGGPSFGLALSICPEPHWSALAPSAPLRRFGLVELDMAGGLTAGRLRIAESVLHHLVGVGGLDQRLIGVLRPLDATTLLATSHRAVAARIADIWRGCAPFAVELVGEDEQAARDVAAEAAIQAGLTPFALALAELPEALLPVLRRDLSLTGGMLLIEARDGGERLSGLADGIASPLAIATRTPQGGWRSGRPRSFRLNRPEAGEERALWQDALAGRNIPAPTLSRVISQFRLPASGIVAVGSQVADGDEAGLWSACRAEARAGMGGLAERIEPRAKWDDLVLPPPQLRLLRGLEAQLVARDTVYNVWGFGARSARGLGITALFAGSSGTGKTMAAEVIAGSLDLDLYRIDLSQVVSKWLGETEKNLARVFDAAEAGGAVLLFDEADALFGKRSEVKDSHDRYANVEVSFLLQRMESYRGLALLTTNSEEALDGAFVRRLRAIVQFPFPDAAHRMAIWQRVFPSRTPTEDLRPEKLARLPISGGVIRNVALIAAFLAAAEGAPVRMAHLREAARTECEKLKRPVSAAEIGDW